MPERRLADARRADEAEDRAARVGLELAHGEELEDAVLHLLDVVVVAVEDPARLLQVEVVVGRDLDHGSDGEPLEVAADHAVLGRLRRQALEALQLALGLLHRVLGQVGGLDLLAQLGGLGLRLVDLAELVLDRLELLAQEELALALVDLGLDLRLDLRPDRDQLQLAREQLGQPAQALGHVALLEQLLALLGLDPQRAGDHVRQLRRVLEVRHRQLQLLGEIGDLLDDLGEGGLDVAVEGLELRRGLDLVGHLDDLRDEVGVALDELPDLDPLRRRAPGSAASRRAP